MTTVPSPAAPVPAPRRRPARYLLVALAAVLGAAGCGHLMMMMHGTGAQRPAPEAFGYGPLTSVHGTFTASVEPEEPVKVRKVHAWTLTLTDAQGGPLELADVEVDGGMPSHGHGLPTRPRVTAHLGGGAYRVEGMRFNMRGWWEVRFRVRTAAGADSVVFNLDL